jgi:hypothetical protein
MRARVSRHDEIKGPMGKRDCQNSKARELSAANGRSSRTTTPHSHHFCSPSPRITNLGQPTDCDFAPVAVSLADRAVEAFHIGRLYPDEAPEISRDPPGPTTASDSTYHRRTLQPRIVDMVSARQVQVKLQSRWLMPISLRNTTSSFSSETPSPRTRTIRDGALASLRPCKPVSDYLSFDPCECILAY